MAVTAVHCLLLHHVYFATAWVSRHLLQGTFTSFYFNHSVLFKNWVSNWTKLIFICQNSLNSLLMWNPARLRSELLKLIFLGWFKRQISILNISQVLMHFIFDHNICTAFPKHISVLNLCMHIHITNPRRNISISSNLKIKCGLKLTQHNRH